MTILRAGDVAEFVASLDDVWTARTPGDAVSQRG